MPAIRGHVKKLGATVELAPRRFDKDEALPFSTGLPCVLKLKAFLNDFFQRVDHLYVLAGPQRSS